MQSFGGIARSRTPSGVVVTRKGAATPTFIGTERFEHSYIRNFGMREEAVSNAGNRIDFESIGKRKEVGRIIE